MQRFKAEHLGKAVEAYEELAELYLKQGRDDLAKPVFEYILFL